MGIAGVMGNSVQNQWALGRVWPALWALTGTWRGLGPLCPYWPEWLSGHLAADGGTAGRRSGRTGPVWLTSSSSCGGRELLLVGGPERRGAAGSERSTHLDPDNGM